MQYRNLGNLSSPNNSKSGMMNSSQFVSSFSSSNGPRIESSQNNNKNQQKYDIKSSETAPSFLSKRKEQVFQSMIFPTTNSNSSNIYLNNSGYNDNLKKDFEFKERIKPNYLDYSKKQKTLKESIQLNNQTKISKQFKSPNSFQNSEKKSIDKYNNIPLLRVRMSHGQGNLNKIQKDSPVNPKKLFQPQITQKEFTIQQVTSKNQQHPTQEKKSSESTLNSSAKLSNNKCPTFLKKDSPSQKNQLQISQSRQYKFSNFNSKKVANQSFWPLAVSPIDSNNQEQSKQRFNFQPKSDSKPEFLKKKPTDFLSNSFNKNLTPMNSVSSSSNYPNFQFGRLSSPNAFNRRGQIKKQEKQIQKKFSLEDFQMIQKLGKGAFGDVFLAKQRKIGFLCVLKKVSKKKIKQLKLQHHIIRQIKIQSYLSHRHLTSIYGYFADQQYLYLILQCLPTGSLNQIKKKKKIPEAQTSRILKQVCEGLKFMHKLQIIHRDLKPQNIFMNESYVKIGDFGCAVYSQSLRTTIVGCLAYISPQQLNNESYDDKIDVWSVGVLTYQMLTGKAPFQQDIIKISRQQKDAKLSQLSFPSQLNLSQAAKDFIKKLLKHDPQERMDISQALRHQFITKQAQIDRIYETQTLSQVQSL